MKWAQAIQKSSIWDLRRPCDSWLSNHNMWGGRKQFPSGTKKTRSHPDPTSRAAGSPEVTQWPLTGAFPWWRQEDGQLRSCEVLWRSPSHLHTGANHVLKSRQTVYLPHPRPLFLLLVLLILLSVWPAAGKKGCTSGNWPFARTATVQSCLSNGNYVQGGADEVSA